MSFSARAMVEHSDWTVNIEEVLEKARPGRRGQPGDPFLDPRRRRRPSPAPSIRVGVRRMRTASRSPRTAECSHAEDRSGSALPRTRATTMRACSSSGAHGKRTAGPRGPERAVGGDRADHRRQSTLGFCRVRRLRHRTSVARRRNRGPPLGRRHHRSRHPTPPGRACAPPRETPLRATLREHPARDPRRRRRRKGRERQLRLRVALRLCPRRGHRPRDQRSHHPARSDRRSELVVAKDL